VTTDHLDIKLPEDSKVLVETYRTTNRFMRVDGCVINNQYGHHGMRRDRSSVPGTSLS
jgi:hypothetical protein